MTTSDAHNLGTEHDKHKNEQTLQYTDSADMNLDQHLPSHPSISSLTVRLHVLLDIGHVAPHPPSRDTLFVQLIKLGGASASWFWNKAESEGIGKTTESDKDPAGLETQVSPTSVHCDIGIRQSVPPSRLVSCGPDQSDHYLGIPTHT